MGKKKEFDQLSPATRKRYTNYYNAHPEGTLAGARGHPENLKPPGPNASSMEEAMYSYRVRKSSIALKETLGLISHAEAKEATTILKEMEKTVKKAFTETSPGKNAREYYKLLEENEIYFSMLKDMGLAVYGPGYDEIDKGAVYYHA